MLNGNALGHDVLTRDEINTLITTSGASVGLVKQGNGYCLEINTTPQTGTNVVNLMPSGDGVQSGMVYVKGVKYAAMTQFQIDALANLEAGTTVYNTTNKALQLYIGSKWVDLYAGDILKDYKYRTANTAPATGEVTLNDTDLTAATLLRVHHTDDDGDDVSAVLIAVQVGSVVELEGNQQKAVYNVAAITDQTNHTEYTVTWASGDVTTPFTDGQKVLFDIPDSSGGGVSKFTELDDVPGSYIGHAGKLVAVKGSEDGVEFTTPVASEPPLGNPANDGEILASTAAGVRSWVAAPDKTIQTASNYQRWDSTVAYKQDQLVLYNGLLYRLRADMPGAQTQTPDANPFFEVYIGHIPELAQNYVGEATPATDPGTLNYGDKGTYYIATAAGDYLSFRPPGVGLYGVQLGQWIVWDGHNWKVEKEPDAAIVEKESFIPWTDTNFVADQLVLHNGVVYIAKQDINVATGLEPQDDAANWDVYVGGTEPTGLEKFADGTTAADEGWKLKDNPTTVTGAGAVNLMATGDAPQPNMVYMPGMRLNPMTQAQIDAMAPEEGTHVWNATLQAEQVYDGNEWRIEEMTNRLSEFKFETAITTPPSVGYIRTDNADPSLATKIYVSEQNDHNHDISAYMNKLVPGNRLTILGADQFVSIR